MISVNENEPVIPPTITVLPPGQLPPLTFKSEDVATLSAEARSQLTGRLRLAGYTDEQIKVALPAVDPAAAIQPGPAHGNGVVLDVAQQQAAWQKLYDNFTGDPAIVLAQLPEGIQIRGADGTFMSAKGANISTVPPYNLRYAGLPGIDDLDPEVLQGINREVVSTFGPLRVPEGIVQQFVDALVRTLDSTADMDDAQRAAHQESEASVVSGLADSKMILELADAGRKAIEKANPGWYKNMGETTALDSAVSILALAAIGRSLKR